jgi:hypothetical protein
MSREWAEAAIKLGRDPAAKVLCPIRHDRYLDVFDVPFEGGDMVDRHLICPGCGARSVISRLHRDLSKANKDE